MRIQAGLGWWRGEPGGARWLDELPALVAACAERWKLRLGAPFEPARIALVVPATLRSGEEAVLKVNFPEPESEQEPDALAHWDGSGAVRLLGRDDERRALLLERCRPGTQLWATADEDAANAVAASVLRQLRRSPPDPHPYRLLAAEAERWADELPRRWRALGHPFEQALLDEAVSACRELGPDPVEPSVLHQDLHGGNVLRAGHGWVAIDPKPLVGDPAFDVASLLRDRRWLLGEQGAGRRVRLRLDLLAADLGLDRERARRWGIAHALAWGVDGTGADESLVESARLLAAAP